MAEENKWEAVPTSPISPLPSNVRGREFPTFPFLCMTVNCLFWCSYALVIEDYVILLCNGVGVVLSIYYHYLIFNLVEEKMIYVYKTAASVAVFLIGFLFITYYCDPDQMPRYLGMTCAIAAIVMIGSPLANLKEVIEKRNADSIPFLLAIAATLNSVNWAAYGLLLKNTNIWLPNTIGAVLGFAQLTLKFIFKSSTPQVFSLNK